jgi:hypothetical protein
VPTEAFREAPMSHYRRLKIEGGAFFYMLALGDRGGDATESSGRSNCPGKLKGATA